MEFPPIEYLKENGKILYECGNCKQIVQDADIFTFRGRTEPSINKGKRYWKGYLCFTCQFRMRDAIGI